MLEIFSEDDEYSGLQGFLFPEQKIETEQREEEIDSSKIIFDPENKVISS